MSINFITICVNFCLQISQIVIQLVLEVIFLKKFSDILIELRKEAKMSQQELADKLQVSRSTIGMYENGDRVPTKEGMEAIADLFNVDMDYLYGRTDIRRKYDFEKQNGVVLEDIYFSFAKKMQEKKVPKEDLEKLWKFYKEIKNL